MVSSFVGGRGCGSGGSRPHTVRFAAKNRPTAPSATAPRKSVLDSDCHVFGLSECHDGLTTISPVLWCFDAFVLHWHHYRQTKLHMSRLTITLDDTLHQALREAAARQGRSIAGIIEESLRLRGIQPTAHARALVARVRLQSQRSESAAMELALQEVWAARQP